jgi:hypothetical protein
VSIFDDVEREAWGRSYTPRVCSFVDVHPQQHQTLSHCAQPPTADVTCALVSHLHSSARPDSRQTPTPDQPSSCSRHVIPAPAHRVRALGAAPDPALRSNGPWPHVTSGLLAPPGYIAILIFRPVSDPLCVGYRLRAIASWVPGVPGAHREADWGGSLGHIDSIRARKGTTTPNLPAREHLCSAKRCCGSCLTSARAALALDGCLAPCSANLQLAVPRASFGRTASASLLLLGHIAHCSSSSSLFRNVVFLLAFGRPLTLSCTASSLSLTLRIPASFFFFLGVHIPILTLMIGFSISTRVQHPG